MEGEASGDRPSEEGAEGPAEEAPVEEVLAPVTEDMPIEDQME